MKLQFLLLSQWCKSSYTLIVCHDSFVHDLFYIMTIIDDDFLCLISFQDIEYANNCETTYTHIQGHKFVEVSHVVGK